MMNQRATAERRDQASAGEHAAARLVARRSCGAVCGAFTATMLALAIVLVMGKGPVEAALTQQVLHSANVTIGSTTFNTMNESAPTGTVVNATAPMTRDVWTTFTEGGVSTFASNVVPAGQSWQIGGGWTFTGSVRNTDRDGVAMSFRATVYRISASGIATSLATFTGPSTTTNTTFALRSWTGTLAATSLAAGERFGVKFEVQETDGRAGNVEMRLDFAPQASASLVSVPIVVVSAPGAPTGVTATPGNAQASVSWIAPASDGGSPITSYTVTSSPDGMTATTPNGSTTTAVVVGLTNGTAYTFTVTATNANGTGPASAPSAAVTPATVPGAPTAVTATAGNAEATVQWTPPASNGGSAITGYTVTSNPGGLTATTATTNATVTGLTNGTAYTFTVIATNAIGNGPASAASNSVTPTGALTAPGAPTNVSASGGNTTATVLWSPPASNGGSPITSYTVTSSPGGITATSPDGSSTSLIVTGLTNGITYTFTVTATNAIGTGPASAPSNAVTPGTGSPPGPPSVPSALAGNTVATVQWIAPASDGGSPILYYTVTSSPGGITAVTPDGTTTSIVVTGLTNGVSYTFTVTATNGLGTSTPSVPSNAVIPGDYPGDVRAAHYRVGRDRPLTAMEWYATNDTPVTTLTWGEIFRVRMQVYNNGNSAKTWTPRLDVSTLPNSGYAALPIVAGAEPFHVYNTTQFANGATIGTADFGLGVGSGTAQAGIAYDAANPAGAAITLNALSYTEVEFSVFATNNAVQGQAYYFRITDGGVAFTSYDSGPAQISVGFPMPAPPTPQPPAHNFHQPYSGDTSACAACHRAHTGPAPKVLYKQWPEEAVCFTCHDGSAAPNIKSQFDKTYRMPIAATVGVHDKAEARNRDPLSFRDGNRHVECADCHNPHLAGRGNHTVGSNYAFAPQQGVWGISVANTEPWTAPTFTTTYPIQFQYQLCFKCHSSWAYGANPPLSPSSPTQVTGGFLETDQAKEFNTLNPAYHPVEDVGKNPFTKADGSSYASSLIGGFTPTGRMVCSDCHMSETGGEAAGPHGSTRPFILRGQWDRTTGRSGTSNHLCFNCHAWTTYGPGSSTTATGFSGDRGNLHGIMVGARNRANGDQPIVCQDCHVAIVHGYHRDHLIGFTGDGQPYVNRPYSGGLIRIDQWRASGQWVYDSCNTAMDSCR